MALHAHTYELDNLGTGAFALVEVCELAPKRAGWRNRVVTFTASSAEEAQAIAQGKVRARAGVCAWSEDGKA